MHWMVCTPEFTDYDYYQIDPPETGKDCVFVDAPTKRKAIVLGVKMMRSPDYMRGWHTYYRWHLGKDENPYRGVTAEPSVCEHGYCWCDINECLDSREYDICPMCDLNFKQSCDHEISALTLDGVESECCWKCLSTKEEIGKWNDSR